ncbi:LOW QUALITY PROTEIN: hypothetical protein MKX08_000521 [Trichoderma sp. CBMAI-0020]|nr:LOW QUALITY PROTEIN: hypothetical protein MKX08_000521 [Trichoderma sp. CBMAI-0020]
MGCGGLVSDAGAWEEETGFGEAMSEILTPTSILKGSTEQQKYASQRNYEYTSSKIAAAQDDEAGDGEEDAMHAQLEQSRVKRGNGPQAWMDKASDCTCASP